MLSFLKKIFGAKPTKVSAAPYKVEASEHFPFPKSADEKKPTKTKKPVAKKTTTKKAKTPKA